MHTQVDMPDSQYWSTQRPGTFPGNCPSGSPSTAGYQDVVPFTTVSSFNFPATADSALLTPISNAESPPLQQRHPTKGTMRAYHPSHPSGSAQQPTPPNTSTGGYYPGYELSSSSQSPSPLTVQPHSTEYAMQQYMRPSSNHIHGHPSPKDDVPPPPSNSTYFGSYTVSGNCSDYPEYSGHGFDPSLITQGPSGAMPNMHASYGAATTPIIAQPDVRSYRMHLPPQPGYIEDLSRREMLPLGNPGQPTYTSPGRNRPPHKVGKRLPREKRPPSRPFVRAMEEAGRNTDLESLGDGDEVVTLSEKCDEEARFIFETRKALVDSGMKGKGMWEEISRKYEEVHGQRLEKATLQMRLTRAFAKHAIWPEKELDRLREAYEYIEQRRYKLVLARMREIGGGQCWNWTPHLIEAKLIDLGFEEPNIDEKSKTRKRRRQARRRAAVAQQSQAILQGGEQQHWANGLGLHPGVMQGPMQHRHEGSEDPEDMMPHYTAQQRNQYLEEVVNAIKPDEEDSSPEPDVLDISYQGSEDNRDHQSQHQDTRVAKQAVEHLMLNQIRM